MWRVIAVTGKRGGYEAMRPLLKKLHHDKEIDLYIFATDQHLSLEFGKTINTIEIDFPDKVIPFDMCQKDLTQEERNKAIARCSVGFSETCARIKPHGIILYGDRGEVLACACSSVYSSALLFHFQGGDISGCKDDKIRHSLTQLCDYHFVSNEKSRDVVIQMGNNPYTVFNVGDLHIDEIINSDLSLTFTDRNFYQIDDDLFSIFLLHPDTNRLAETEKNILSTLKAIDYLINSLGHHVIAIYPCSDPGSQIIIQHIEDYANRNKKFHLHKNIEALTFKKLLYNCEILIGNSSSGIVESAYTKTKVVNIGERQLGRICPKNVVHSTYKTTDIINALKIALNNQEDSTFEKLYGDGNSCSYSYEIVKRILKEKQLDVKRFSW